MFIKVLKKGIKSLLPPFLSKILTRISPYGFHGNYIWDEAIQMCKNGYREQEIIDKAFFQVEKFKMNQISTTINNRNIRLLAAILQSIISNNLFSERISITDFGGGMGNHYFALRKFLPVRDLTWQVLELPQMVSYAKEKNMESSELKFQDSLEEFRNTNIALASSSIQYCEKPNEIILNLAKKAHFVILDRLPLCENLESDRLTIQRVNPSIYAASYPAWFLSERKFNNSCQEYGLELILRWDVPEDKVFLDGNEIIYSGLLYKTRIKGIY
jgi:putative methyltransferase (TIGR04325 family)